jgi:leader peptidase (prepilin peptidase) / N-methyltransferase
MRNAKSDFSIGRLVFIVVLLATFIYIVGSPLLTLFKNRELQRKSIVEVSLDLDALQSSQIQAAKISAFLIFAYLGASMGSFLNVVAYCIPRGESFALRSSACPKCKTRIRRLDNLPIIGFLRLHGRCRACDAPISMRYLWVEVLAACVYASLFVFELSTGASNVPFFKEFAYTGVVEILLYTKWDVLGIYLFHCAMFTFLITIALIHFDGQKVPKSFGIGCLLTCACLPILIPTLRTVAVDAYLPFELGLEGIIGRVISSIMGVLCGWLCGTILQVIRTSFAEHRGSEYDASQNELALCSMLVGACLGWQAVATIAFISMPLMMLTAWINDRYRNASMNRELTERQSDDVLNKLKGDSSEPLIEEGPSQEVAKVSEVAFSETGFELDAIEPKIETESENKKPVHDCGWYAASIVFGLVVWFHHPWWKELTRLWN